MADKFLKTLKLPGIDEPYKIPQTAEDVNARPADWMPSAEDVGAISKNNYLMGQSIASGQNILELPNGLYEFEAEISEELKNQMNLPAISLHYSIIVTSGYNQEASATGTNIYKSVVVLTSDGDMFKNYCVWNTWKGWQKVLDSRTKATDVGAAIGNGYLQDGVDLNTVTASGMYRLSDSPVNAAPGISWGQLLVIHGGSDTITQIACDYDGGKLWTRSGDPSDVGGSGSWGEWAQIYDSSHKPTASDIGAAPSGYGLGEDGRNIDIYSYEELDTICKNGWYRVYFPNNLVIGGVTMNYAIMRVSNHDGGNCIQELMPIGTPSMLQRTRFWWEAWGEWEWVNPPLWEGVEFRTTERFAGEPVYTKQIRYGTMPNNNRYAVAHGASVRWMLRCAGLNYSTGAMFPNDTVSVFADHTHITIVTTADCSSQVAYVQIWYTKD